MKKVVTKTEARLQRLSHFLRPVLSHPSTYVVMGVGILLLYFWGGELLIFPFLFILPVSLSAWFCSARLSCTLAVVLPFGRFCIAYFVEGEDSMVTSIANAFIRATVLGLMAFLVARTAHQTREIRVLRGWLATCMWCKRIRTESGDWQNLETYIAEHSEAEFTHSLCPACKEEHYGALLAKKG